MGTVLVKAREETTVGFAPNETILAPRKRKVSVGLWVVQGVLALLFLFAGGMKLVVPAEVLATMTPLPILFMKFIGLAEVLGGLGLILPGLLRIRPGLTTIAAACLAVEMFGATITTLVIGGGVMAVMPLVVGLLAACVAYGRCHLSPQTERSEGNQTTAPTKLLTPRGR